MTAPPKQGHLVAFLSLLALLVGSAIAACGPLAPSNAMPPCQPNNEFACTEVNGFPLGRIVDCAIGDAGCEEAFASTRSALDGHDTNHAPVTRVQKFEVDMARVCGSVVCAFSGGRSIVLFTFADGTLRALGYDCPGVATCRATFGFLDYSSGNG